MSQVINPFSIYLDSSGEPITGGKVYVGTTGLNPITNPIPLYFDSEFTIPAANPISLVGGYAWRTGSPAQVFANASSYSILVRDKQDNLVFSTLDSSSSQSTDTIIFTPTWPHSVPRILTSKLMDFCSVKDFGAGPDKTDVENQQAFEYALAAAYSVYIPEGNYNLVGNLYTAGEGRELYGAGVGATKLTITGANPGLILGNSPSTASPNLNCMVRDFSVIAGTRCIQVGSENSPLTYLGQISNIKCTDGSEAGIFLYQGIVNIQDVECSENYRGLVTRTPANGGGEPTNSIFTRLRLYQNENEGAYLEQSNGFLFSECDFEQNGKEGVKFAKYSGTVIHNVCFENCWFETNQTDGTITSNAGSVTSTIISGGSYPSYIVFSNCIFNGVTNYATLYHIYGAFESINIINQNYFVQPNIAIKITTVNTLGVSDSYIGNFETGYSAKLNIINGSGNYFNGDFTLTGGTFIGKAGLGNNSFLAQTGNITTTDGSIKCYNGTSASGNTTYGGFFTNLAEAGVGARYMNMGGSGRTGWLFTKPSVIGSRMWVDDSNTYRTKISDPANPTDGTVIGTQTFTGTHIYFLGDTDLQIGEAVDLIDRKIYRTVSETSNRCVGIYAGKSSSLITSFSELVAKTIDENGNISIQDRDKPGVVISLGDTRYDHNNQVCLGVLVTEDVIPGDLLVPSSTPGRLKKQGDSVIRSNTIAKVIEAGDSNAPVYCYMKVN